MLSIIQFGQLKHMCVLDFLIEAFNFDYNTYVTQYECILFLNPAIEHLFDLNNISYHTFYCSYLIHSQMPP